VIETPRGSRGAALEVLMRDLRDKRVLITGGAAGIGRSLADRFASRGARLVLGDVNATALDGAVAALRQRGATASGYVLDVTDAAAIGTVRQRILDEQGPIDILVNNAGIVFGGPFVEVPLEKHLATFRVNVFGVVAMTHAFLPDLISRPEGHLVNMASASGLIGLPYGSTYASSKWAVIGFSESIRLELAMLGHRRVGVTTVCPSYVSTGLFEGARPPKTTSLLTADQLAAKVIRGVERNRAFVLTPWLVKVTPMLKGVLPGRVFDVVAWQFGATSGMSHWKGRSPN
jgi:short-subunit dehydrogenase